MTQSGLATTHAHALATGAGFQLRPDLGAIRVTGDDRLSWLNGQITNDLRQLEQAESARALAVNVRGKILADLWVTSLADALIVLLPRSSQPALLESLERYIIMEDVELGAWEGAAVLSLQGPEALGLAQRVSLSVPEDEALVAFGHDELGQGGQVWIGEPARIAAVRDALLSLGAPEVGDAGYELARLRAGVPRYGVDFGERQYPQEAGLKAWVSFNKGCYLGQEVVCTLENRGRLTRRLVRLRAPAPATGASLPSPGSALSDASGEATGEVTSAVLDEAAGEVIALGYVKRGAALPNATLSAADAPFLLDRIIGDEARR